jgi:hypothetical protein
LGCEISSTSAPVCFSFASRAMSAWATTPTSRPSCSTTGSRRTWLLAISWSASSSFCCGSIVTTRVEATSRTATD